MHPRDSSMTPFYRNTSVWGKTGQNRGGTSCVGQLFGPIHRFEVLDHSATRKKKLSSPSYGVIPLYYTQIQHSGWLTTVETEL